MASEGEMFLGSYADSQYVQSGRGQRDTDIECVEVTLSRVLVYTRCAPAIVTNETLSTLEHASEA